jgi:hypothetical protein
MNAQRSLRILSLFYLFIFTSQFGLGQIHFSMSFREIVHTKNGIESTSSVWEFVTVEMILDNNKSKINISYYDKTRDSISLKQTLNLEQIEHWSYLDEKEKINWCLVKNPKDNKHYIAIFVHYIDNTSQFSISEYDIQKQALTGNNTIFRNSESNEKDMLSFLSSDGMSVYRYDVSHTNSFDLSNSVSLARNSERDNIKLSYTSDQVFQKDEKDYMRIIFPPDYQHAYLLHRDISRNITYKDGIYTFRNDSVLQKNGTYGIGGGEDGFDKFTYSWFFPDNIEIVNYKCNRSGKWNQDDRSIIFHGDKGIDNILFEISYKIKNVPAKEIEKTNISLKETISIPDKKTKVSIWDNHVEDGDIISLSLNGEWIVRNLEVKKCRTSIYLNLDPGENYLVMKAENTGSEPPNTAAFLFESANFSKEIVLKSDLGKSEMIQINVK